MARKVVFIQGGGIGLDQEAGGPAAVRGRRGAGRVRCPHGRAGRALEQGRDAAAGRRCSTPSGPAGVALKTKLLQPKGAGTPTAHGPNVPHELQRRLPPRARAVRLGAAGPQPRRASRAGSPDVDFLLVREITEDLYTASEHEIVPGVVQSFKVVTEAACLRFFRFAFELARKQGRKSVHCVHKANILKMADGLFLDCFRRVAAEFPEITAKDLIVDNACMQLVEPAAAVRGAGGREPVRRPALRPRGRARRRQLARPRRSTTATA